MNKIKKDISKYKFPRTMSELIYDSLKESIITNELKANQRINEKEICESFHVSRTPVREAILRLAAEGFVKIDSYRRVLVKEISFEELGEILQVLGALDSLAISMAVDNLSQNGIKKLEKLTQRMEENCDLNSVEKYIELNAKFHDELWKYVPNEFLAEMLQFVREKKERYSYARLYAYKMPGFLEKSMNHHREIMKNIKLKNKEKLKDMIVSHRNLIIETATKKQKEEIKKYLNFRGEASRT